MAHYFYIAAKRGHAHVVREMLTADWDVYAVPPPWREGIVSKGWYRERPWLTYTYYTTGFWDKRHEDLDDVETDQSKSIHHYLMKHESIKPYLREHCRRKAVAFMALAKSRHLRFGAQHNHWAKLEFFGIEGLLKEVVEMMLAPYD